MEYRPEIDGLRAIAVIPVILFHAGFTLFGGGYVGVDIFFVVSGYLITTIIAKDLERGHFSLIHFYERRARRILPALVLVILACIPAAWVVLLPADMKDFMQSMASVSVFSSNILFWLKSGYFDISAELKPLLHTWSLAVEEQYYILFPLLLIAGWGLGMKRLAVVFAVILVLSLGVAEWAAYDRPTAAFYLLPTRGWELLIGALAALYHRTGKIGLGHPWRNLASGAGLILIFASVFLYDHRTPFPSHFALLPTLGAFLVIAYATPKTIVNSVLGSRVLVGIGLISYSAYLWHQPLFSFQRHVTGAELSVSRAAGLIAVTLVLAYLSWRYVEQPFRQKGVVGRRTIFLASGISLCALLAIGLVGHATAGFRDYRFDGKSIELMNSLSSAKIQRQRAIRAGICHFNEQGMHRDIDGFASQWQCYTQEDGLRASDVLVFGDSHSADKAVALRANGVDVVQLGGAGCPLSPEDVPPEKRYCHTLYGLLDRAPEIKGVLLANRFPENELSRDYLKRVVDFWAAKKVPVLIFSPMPNFSGQMRETILYGHSERAPDNSQEELFFRLLSEIDLPPNVGIIRTSDLWCSHTDGAPGPGQPCAVFDHGAWLMTDADHLSVQGAEIFGERLLRHPAVRELFAPRRQ